MEADLNPTLSVVTPAFNAEQFIVETLDSVASLRTPHEHVVVDDGSTDATARILRERDDPALVVVHQENGGQASAVNTGLAHSRGELLAWLNADDTYNAEYVDAAIEILLENPRVDAIYGYMDVVGEDGELLKTARCGPFSWYRYFLVGDYWPTPTAIFRRSLLTQAPQLDQRYTDTSDVDFYLRLFRGANVRRVRRPLVRFRYHPASKTGSRPDEMFDEARDARLRLARNGVERRIIRMTDRLRRLRESVTPFWPQAQDGG